MNFNTTINGVELRCVATWEPGGWEIEILETCLTVEQTLELRRAAEALAEYQSIDGDS